MWSATASSAPSTLNGLVRSPANGAERAPGRRLAGVAEVTCARPVIPGLDVAHPLLEVRNRHAPAARPARGARGADRRGSCRRASTLKNCGSSSMRVLRRNFPTRVMRGSFSVASTGPLSFSASGRIERNLEHREFPKLRLARAVCLAGAPPTPSQLPGASLTNEDWLPANRGRLPQRSEGKKVE